MFSATFPGGASPVPLVPGLLPGQLFAGGGASGPRANHSSASQASNTSQYLQNASASVLHQILASQQQMSAMLQTLFHQQQALQSQVQQVVLTLQQHLQLQQAGMAGYPMYDDRGHEQQPRFTAGVGNADDTSTASPPQCQKSPKLSSRDALVHSTVSNVTGDAPSTCGLSHAGDAVASSSSLGLFPSGALSSSGIRGSSVDYPLTSASVHTQHQASRPSTPVQHQPPSQDAMPREAPRRSPSKPIADHPTRDRFLDQKPVPLRLSNEGTTEVSPEVHRSVTEVPKLASDDTGYHHQSHQSQQHAPSVALSWLPKRYSRSSSVGSSSGAPSTQQPPTSNAEYRPATPRSASQLQQQVASNPLLGQRQFPQPSLNRPHDSQNTSGYSASQYSASAGNVSRDDHLAASGPSIRAAPSLQHSQQHPSTRTPWRTSSQVAVAPSTALHDVSLSDDGYMSMDTAQYMRRFNLS